MADTNTSYTISLVPVGSDDSGSPVDPLVGGSEYDPSEVSLSMSQLGDTGKLAYEECRVRCEENFSISIQTAAGEDFFASSAYDDCLKTCSYDNCSEVVGITIKVTKNPADLNYKLETTYGELGVRIEVDSENFAESVNVNLNSSYAFGNNVLSNASIVWEGNVYDEFGNLINPPGPLTYDETTRQVEWGGQVVVGTLRITATESYDTYALLIPPREDSTTESAWQATIRAFFSVEGVSQIETLDVQEPSIADTCYGGSGETTTINPDDPDDPDSNTCWKRVYEVDPCTGVSTRKPDVKIACPETEEEPIG